MSPTTNVDDEDGYDNGGGGCADYDLHKATKQTNNCIESEKDRQSYENIQSICHNTKMNVNVNVWAYTLKRT